MKSQAAFAVVLLTVAAGVAQAEEPAAPVDPAATTPPDPTIGTASAATPPPEEPTPVKEPKRGDFDAGGQVRLPNGPDEMGGYATFNWIALDLKARYYLLKSVTVTGNFPLAVKHPDNVALGTQDPRMIGGMSLRFDAMLPRGPTLPLLSYKTDLGLSVTGAYMREGSMLLSEKDFPLFVGDFKPGVAVGLVTKIKLSTLLDLSLLPSVVYQSGTMNSLTALQVPLSLNVKLGETLKVSADAGVFTGDDFSFGGSKNGRIAAGGSLTVKLGPILAHAGAGVASLLTGGLYPTIADSLYIDLNVKYAK